MSVLISRYDELEEIVFGSSFAQKLLKRISRNDDRPHNIERRGSDK
jgi:hypothetical protein